MALTPAWRRGERDRALDLWSHASWTIGGRRDSDGVRFGRGAQDHSGQTHVADYLFLRDGCRARLRGRLGTLGAFALIMVAVLSPATPSAEFGLLPSTALGLGTTVVLVLARAVMGSLIRRQRLPEQLAQQGTGRGRVEVARGRGSVRHRAGCWTLGSLVHDGRTACWDPRAQPRPDQPGNVPRRIDYGHRSRHHLSNGALDAVAVIGEEPSE